MEEPVVSVSRLKTYLRCRKQYDYRYVEKLRPKIKPVPFERGAIIHKCLEAHYTGGDWTATLTAWQAEVESKLMPFFSEKDKEEWASMPGEVYRIVRGYLQTYAAHDAQFEILGVELERVVTLPSGIRLVFIVDRLLREKATGLKFILDTKTVKDMPGQSMRLNDLQTSIYSWAEEQATGEPVAGTIWDYVLTKPPTIPELLKRGGMSRDKRINCDWPTYKAALLANDLDPKDYAEMMVALQDKAFYRRLKQARPDDLINNLLKEFDYTARQVAQTHKMIAEGRPPLLQRTVLLDCQWGCPYAELCFTELSGQPAEWLRNERFDRKDTDSREADPEPPAEEA